MVAFLAKAVPRETEPQLIQKGAANIWPATRSASSLHPWIRRFVWAVRGLSLIALGHVSKPVVDQIFDLSFWKNYKPGQTAIASLAWPTPEILSLIAGVWFVTFLFDTYWLNPLSQHADLVNGALEHLYRQWFDGTSGHRVSFLAKRRWGKHIRVFFRYAHGTSTRFKSSAHFGRGAAVAGMAWKYPSGFVALPIPDFQGDKQKFREFMCQTYNMSRHQARLLSDETAEVRWIVCYGIVDPDGEFQGVLSVDSIYPNTQTQIDPQRLKDLADLIGTMMYSNRRGSSK